MNGKTCLLCGRPLGLIRVGSGGDFCSREHRNQYRLRRSMDCLTEANIVSTLARRRENPKPLAVGTVQNAGAMAAQAMLAAPRFPGQDPGRPALKLIQADLRKNPQLSGAGPAPPRLPAKAPRGASREAGMRLQVKPAGQLSGPTASRLASPTRLNSPQRYRKLKPAANIGNALRVSARGGFRNPRLRLQFGNTQAQLIIGTYSRGARALRPAPSLGRPTRRICAVTMPAHPSGLMESFRARSYGARFEGLVAGHIPAPAAKDRKAGLGVAPGGRTSRSAAVALRRQVTPPTLDIGIGEAILPALRTARLHAVSLRPAAGRPEARLSFGGMAFTGAPDAPAQLWVGDSGQEIRKS